VAQPRVGLLAVGFSRLDQAVKLSAGRRAFGRVAEQPILAPDHEGPDRTFGGVVVDRQLTGFGVAHQIDPVAGQVADGFAQCTLRSHLWLGFLQTCVQLGQHRQAVLLSAFMAMFSADFF